MKTSLTLVLCGLFLATSITHAQEVPQTPCEEVEEKVDEFVDTKTVELLTSFTPAKPKVRNDPNYPRSAAMRGAEGWVLMSYVVNEEGDVKDPVIEDFGGHKSFKKSAMRAVKKWQFEPAMKNGKPIEQCKSAVRIDFALGGQSGASAKFIKDYKDADELLRAGEILKADKIAQKLIANKYRNRYENAWLWNLDTQIAVAKKDPQRELISLNKTVNSIQSQFSDNPIFNKEYEAVLHRRLFVLLVEQHKFGEAKLLLTKIQEHNNRADILTGIEAVQGYMDDYLRSEKELFVGAQINDEGFYFHHLARNRFGFTNIKGELESVEVRCDSRREIYSVATDNIWKIPESWGKCQILISGDEETSFDLVELAST